MDRIGETTRQSKKAGGGTLSATGSFVLTSSAGGSGPGEELGEGQSKKAGGGTLSTTGSFVLTSSAGGSGPGEEDEDEYEY